MAIATYHGKRQGRNGSNSRHDSTKAYLEGQCCQEIGFDLLEELVVLFILNYSLSMLILVRGIDDAQAKDQLLGVVIAEDTPDISAKLLVDSLRDLSKTMNPCMRPRHFRNNMATEETLAPHKRHTGGACVICC
jgi:hypothetical protein